MSSIDQRIVEMRFDNKQFESGVQASIKSLDDLKNGLKLEGAAKGLSNLEKAGKNFSLSGIAAGVDTIASKFSTLGIIGVTALQNITNSAVNYGKRIVSALTIQPIKMGFDEYETKMGAIQTILTNTASKGTTLEDVNKVLNELNEYSDKTIYNFSEMTKNIGTFTAAGVGLKESAIAIKGIANLAAGSGSTSQQASTAMYQLSQALAAGSVKLQDWNSVVNAGMGGELFQNALRATAKQMGIVVDTSIPFRESLEKGWITTEVLTKTLAKFANDESLIKAATQVKTFTQLFETMKESIQSGWAQTWEIIVGNKDESTAVLTKINDIFGSIVGSSADARNSMLSFWKDNGGRYDLIEALFNAFKGIQEILGPISEAFKEVFPPMTGERLVEITKGIRDLTRNFKIGDETAANIKSTFKGLFAVLDIGLQAVTAIGRGIGSLIKYLWPASSGILAFTGNIGEHLVSLDKAIKTSNVFNLAIQKVGDFMQPIADGVKKAVGIILNVFKSLGSADTSGLDTFSEKVKKRFEPLTKLGEFVHGAFSKIADVVEKVAPIFYKLASIVGKAFDSIRTNILNALDNAEFDSILDIINGGLFAAILLGLKKFISSMTSITDGAGGFLGKITGILDGVKGSLEAYQSSLKADTLIKISIAIGILAASLFVLSTIDSAKLTSSLAAMTAMFVELFGSMTIFEKIMGSAGFKSMGKITLAMMGLSVAVLVLSVAMTKLAKLDWAGISKGLYGVAFLSSTLVATSKLIEKNSKGLIRGAISLILFAEAINVLTSAVAKLGSLDTSSLTKGLIGVGVLCAELAIFMKTTEFSSAGVGKGLGLLILAAAITVLATAVQKFSALDSGALIKGLGAVAVVLAELALFVNLTGDSKKVISTSIGLTILGAAMIVFASAIEKMGSMSLEQIGKGLLTMAGSLAILVVALNLMPKGIVLQATGLVVMASALVILSKALSSMGGMSWAEIAKGLVTLAGSLTIIAIAMAAMTSAIPGSVALLLVAGALSMLAPVLRTLGTMSLAEIGKGLLALAGVFTVVGVAGLLLAPLTPIILGLSAAIALFGVGCLAVGAGILAFSTGLAALAVSGTAGAAALVVIVTSLAGMIPAILKIFAKGIVDFARVVGEGAPVIADAVVKLVGVIATALVKVIPVVVETLFKFLTTILTTLASYVPKMVDAGIKIIKGFLSGVADNIKDVVSTAIKVVINFISGVASMIPKVIQAAYDLILSFINGLADGIRKNTPLMIKAMNNLMSAIIESAMKVLFGSITGFIDIGKNIVLGLIDGIKSMVSSVGTAGVELGKAVMESAKNVLGIHSPSKVFQDYGANIVAGLRNGIKQDTPKAEEESKTMAKKVVKASKDQFEAAKNWIEERKYYNQLSLKEELEAWEKLQNKYKSGTDHRKEVDREVYRVKNEMLKKDFEDSVKWIDERKYYNQLSLVEELAAWERVQGRYKVGTEERKQADREVYRVKKEIIEKQKQLEDEYYAKTVEVNDKLKQDIQSVNEKYEDALASRIQTLYKSYSLFDKVGTPEAITGTELVENLQGQVAAFDEWQKNINELSSKGISEGLLKELEEMGPASIAQIKALNNLTRPELDKYSSLWQQKYSQAKTAAVSELEGLRVETENKISDLTIESAFKLDQLKETYQEQLASITRQTQSQLTDFNSKWGEKFMELDAQNKKDLSLISTNIKNTFKQQDWAGVGKDIVTGITNGVKSQAAVLVNATSAVALQSLNAAKKTLGIKSPSKEFAKVGKYSMEGFAEGLYAFSGVATDAVTDAGVKAKESLSNVLSNIADIVSGNVDMNPTIRPVLDLSAVKTGSQALSTMLNTQPITASTRAIELSGAIVSNHSERIAPVDPVQKTSNETSSIHNSFSISNLVVREEADVKRVARQLYQLQIAGSRG